MKTKMPFSKLVEIGRIQSGAGFPIKYQGVLKGDYPFYKVGDMNSLGNEFYMGDAKNYISEEVRKQLGAKIIPSNSIIFPKVGGAILTNKKRLTKTECCIDNNVMSISIDPKFCQVKYFLYFFNTINLFELSNKAALPSIAQSTLNDLLVPLPPLPEQKRIVSILDDCFAAIDKAKANAEKNLKNAKELFESYLEGVFKNGNWETKTLDEVCEISSKLIDPRKPKYLNLVHVGAGNIESKSGKLNNLKTAKEENLISGKFLFDESMVLYSKIRPYLMKVVKCDFQGLCSADIYPLKPFENVITKEYLYLLLLTREFTDYAILGSQRAGMPKVNREHLFAYKFRLPQIKDQKRIVRQLDALQVETQKLEVLYQKKIKDLEELEKSILHKAFAGELRTSQKAHQYASQLEERFGIAAEAQAKYSKK